MLRELATDTGHRLEPPLRTRPDGEPPAPAARDGSRESAVAAWPPACTAPWWRRSPWVRTGSSATDMWRLSSGSLAGGGACSDVPPLDRRRRRLAVIGAHGLWERAPDPRVRSQVVALQHHDDADRDDRNRIPLRGPLRADLRCRGAPRQAECSSTRGSAIQRASATTSPWPGSRPRSQPSPGG